MQTLYRIYDTVEKRHRTDMFVNVSGYIMREELNRGGYFTIVYVEDQDRYIVERCTGLYDKNNILIYENDILDALSYKFIVEYSLASFCFKGHMKSFVSSVRHTVVIGHALKDSHLLEDK